MFAPRSLTCFGLAGFLALLGCQAGSPTAPTGADPAPAPIAVALTPGTPGQGMLGSAKLRVDRTTGEVTLTPIRNGAAIGDTFPLDATAYFTSDPCRDCMKLTSFALAPDELNLEVTVRHPFPSVTSRRDLDVFDPRVILFAPGTDAWEFTTFDQLNGYLRPDPLGGPPVRTPFSANARMLLNASGYTTHYDERVDFLNGVTYVGTLNPYIDYATELIPNDNSSGNNPEHRMAQTREPESETFRIYFPPEITLFEAILVFEANYGQSATKATRLSPLYFTPSFNRREAYSTKVSYMRPDNGLLPGSQIAVTVGVTDWQHQSAVDLAYPDPANLAGIPQASRVDRVEVSLPGWTETMQISNFAFSGVGTSADPLVYTLTLPRDAVFPPRPDATLPMLVRVVDEMDGQEISNTNPAFDLGQTFDVATYQIVRMGLSVIMANVTDGPSAGMIQRNSGLRIRPAPYANTDEGTAEFELVYPAHASDPFSAPAKDLRMLFAPSSGDFRLVDPSPLVSSLTGEFYADGDLPIDDYPASPDAHPNPDSTMPVRSLGASLGGNFMAAFGDDNFTINPLRFSTGITDLVANSDVVRTWTNAGSVRTPGPRLSEGCGSAPGPSFGSRVRGIVSAPTASLAGETGFLGFISAGLDCEACGDYASLSYYSAPYSSEADRLVTIDLDNIAVSLFAGVPTELNYRRLARIVPLPPRNATNWPHVAFFNNRIVLFNAMAGFNPTTRTSSPTPLGSTLTGLETVIDVCFIPYDADYPFAIGGVAQTDDWVVCLVKGGLTDHRLLAFNTANTPALQADWGGGLPTNWGPTFPPITELDFDPVNRILAMSADSNGVSAGGDILTTFLVTM